MIRKLFGTDGIRGIANTYPMTPEMALKIGKATADIFRNGKKRHKILIGKDTRISGYILETALTAGICSMGVDVLLVGPIPTPAVAHLTKSLCADAAIMISASHNPPEHNGIKFFSSQGIKLPDSVEEEMEKIILSKDISAEHINGTLIGKAYRIDDARGRYIEFAKNSIENSSLAGLKMVLDCANGSAYSVAPDIFRELGADVVILNNNPDGLNINIECGSQHPEQMMKTVKKEKADIGIALDGDADRVTMVDENADFVDGDHIMAMCALDFMKRGKLNKNTLVATVYSNLGLDEAITKAGGRVVRVQNGDRYVIKEMLKHNYTIGGEQSGHIIFAHQTTTGDGVIASLQVLNLMKKTGKKLSELANCMHTYPQILKNLHVKEKKPFDEMPSVQKVLKDSEDRLKGRGRVFVRYSGTENICRIMVEGKDDKEIEGIAQDIYDAFKKEIGA
jgi:phosphoglucosamine mutase